MRVLSIAFLLLLLIASINLSAVRPVAAQAGTDRAVVVTPRTVVIIRRGALIKDFPSKKRATLTYPVISGLKDAQVLRRVQAILQVKNVFDTSIAEYREDNWLEDFSYKVNYNKNSILDITFTQEGSGAYPDTQTRHFAINLKSGSIIKASDVFITSSLPTLRGMLDGKLKSELKEILESLRDSKSDPEDVRVASEAQEPLDYKLENLDDFEVGAKGITFLYDAGYPHAIQAFEPNGRYFFSYSELKPFIKGDGPLGQFVQ
jgi:hypothetical protein